MGPMNSIVYFIRNKFMMATITVTLLNGDELTGKVVDAFDSLIGLDVGEYVVYVNANHIVTFEQSDFTGGIL